MQPDRRDGWMLTEADAHHRKPRAFFRLRWANPEAAVLSVVSVIALLRSYLFTYQYFTWPVWFDLWLWVPDLRRWFDGAFTLHDLVKPQLQHRIATTRLLLLLDARWFDMNGRSIAVINLALLAALGVLLWRVVRLNPPDRASPSLPLLFWIALPVSLCAWENLILPFQVQFAFVCVCAVASALLLSQAASAPPMRAAGLAGGAGLLGIVAAFSMASGVLLAPALWVLLALRRAGPVAWAIFLPLSTLGVALFFIGYSPGDDPPMPLSDWRIALLRVDFAAHFAAAFLNAVPETAAIGGYVVLATLALLAGLLLLRHRWPRQALPAGDAALLCLGGFVALCGAAAAMTPGLMFGPNAALAPRYASMSLLLVSCLLGIGSRLPVSAGTPLLIRRYAISVAALAVLGVANLPIFDTYAAGRQRVVMADTQLLANNVGIAGPTPPYLGGTIADVREDAAFLHARKLNMFAPENGPPARLLAQPNATDPARLPPCRGALESAYFIDDTAFLLRGWATGPSGEHGLDWLVALDAQGPAPRRRASGNCAARPPARLRT